ERRRVAARPGIHLAYQAHRADGRRVGAGPHLHPESSHHRIAGRICGPEEPAQRSSAGLGSDRPGCVGTCPVRWAAGLAALLISCGPTAERRGDTVILASGADLESINPLITTHPLARQVQRYALLTTLLRYDSTLTPVPYLATSWTWTRDSMGLTFRIFAGLKWHDGAPTTAYDAAWTI